MSETSSANFNPIISQTSSSRSSNSSNNSSSTPANLNPIIRQPSSGTTTTANIRQTSFDRLSPITLTADVGRFWPGIFNRKFTSSRLDMFSHNYTI